MIRKVAVVFVCFIVLILYAVHNYREHDKSRLQSHTSFSQHSGGTSVLHAFLVARQPNGVRINQQAFVNAANLDEVSSVLLLAPLSYFSKIEVTNLRKFVSDGGELILGVRSSPQLQVAQGLLSEPQIPKLVRSGDFKNFETTKVTVESSEWLFQKGDEPVFYSRERIEGCSPGSLSCYFYEAPLGKGRVVFLIGFPIFANVLLSKGDNRQVLFRLTDRGGTILIDEYHHLFSDRTLGDLIRTPQFALPLLGLTFLAILYFAFGHSPFHEKSLLSPQKTRSPSHHQLNEDLLQYSFDKQFSFAWVLRKHLSYLERNFPRAIRRIEKLRTQAKAQLTRQQFLHQAAQVTELHRELLKERGRT